MTEADLRLPLEKAPSRVRHSQLSRADALRAYFELGKERIAGAASSLGFVWPEPTPDGDRHRREVEGVILTGGTSGRAEESVTSTAKEEPLAPIPAWRPVAVHRLGDSPEDGSAPEEPDPENPNKPKKQPSAGKLQESDLRSFGPAPPPTPPIVAEPRLRRRLDAELRSPRLSRELDVDALVERLSRGDSVEALPRRVSLIQARLVLILDNSPRLTPFWLDQLLLFFALRERLGPARVRRLPVLAVGAGNPVALDPDEVVLAITDLGFFGRHQDRDRWVRFGRTLVAAGGRLRALVSCPAWRWHGEGPRLWNAIDWSHPEGAGSTQRPRALRLAPVEEPAEALLRLLAPAVRVEPGLLRSVRHLLGEAADLGTEADVWNHPKVDGASSSALQMDSGLQTALTAEGLAEEAGWNPELVEATARLILDWHAGRADVVWAIEAAHLGACGVTDDQAGKERMRKAQEVLERVATVSEHSEVGVTDAALRFWQRDAARAPAGMATDRRFGDLWVRAQRAVQKANPDAPLPAGVTPEMLADPDSQLPIRTYQVCQFEDRLVISPKPDVYEGDAAPPRGSLLAFVSARQLVLYVGNDRQEPTEVELETGEVEVPCPPMEEALRLVTDVEAVQLEAWTQPAWASAAGRDGFGLWAAFEVEGVEQRMRWIPPERFWMGSPETEEGRWDDEGPVHEVLLTEGYWMAETLCTQELWQAVMGENPSRFQAPRRPVERVSWDDCHRFIDRLNFRSRDLELDLPSEAEWEHACRAGTRTATWLGDLQIRGDHDAPLLDPIAWYRGNHGADSSGRHGERHAQKKTGSRQVGGKLASPWGLHDMLGNVWEWCWDRFGGYRSERAIDYEGPEGGALRVSRGGSWSTDARSARAACRFKHEPDTCNSALGFRLSRGPQERGALEPASGSAASEAVLRGMRRRARSRRERGWVERLGWAVDGGLDAYGRWAALEVEGVRHRLRWIYPGRFWMGSRETEAGRFDDEGPRHEVTLAQGFWLGEVPCTQDLWEVVMGSNPSRFVSPRRPVEMVSWEDCQEFFERLRQLVPGFVGRLPTEAQWEYACRAGTSTASWVGDLEILGQRNAPLLDEIAWYGGNSGVDFDLEGGWDSSDWEETQYAHSAAGSRIVGLKKPNPWGLHDLLGNVWEWCSDSWNYGTGYSGAARTDPEGKSGPGRVSRGGSWDALARYVRAAYRGGDGPGVRYHYLGFRLSRGPQEQEGAEPPETESGPEAGPSPPRDEA